MTAEEIREGFKDRVRSYMGGMGDESFLDMTVDRLMNDRQQLQSISEELRAEKIFAAIKAESNLNEKKVSVEDFREIAKAQQNG